MPAYVISEVDLLDSEQADAYRALAQDSIVRYGGRYLVRGAALDVLEGAAASGRLVIVEFPSAEQARRWYASPEYAAALKIRQHALRRRLILVEGVAG
jgi:uncharacterized protein (DUF1330 family)